MKGLTFILFLMLSGGHGGERLNRTFFLSPLIVFTISCISKEVSAGEIAWQPSLLLACEMHGYAHEHADHSAAMETGHHCSASAHLPSLHIKACVNHCDSHRAQLRPRHRVMGPLDTALAHVRVTPLTTILGTARGRWDLLSAVCLVGC